MDQQRILSQKLGALLLQHQQVLTTAESCTGGGIASAMTDIAGSSQWFDRAFVTYSNAAKREMLGVTEETLEQYGAVSEAVVKEMVLGALQHAKATVGVSVSGIAGPDGGSDEKPVGTVCFGFADQQGWLEMETCHFSGERGAVRSQAIIYALTRLIQHFETQSHG